MLRVTFIKTVASGLFGLALPSASILESITKSQELAVLEVLNNNKEVICSTEIDALGGLLTFESDSYYHVKFWRVLLPKKLGWVKQVLPHLGETVEFKPHHPGFSLAPDDILTVDWKLGVTDA